MPKFNPLGGIKMIMLDEKTAQVLLTAYTDIVDIDSRMSCSDAAFRNHYRLLIGTPVMREAVQKLREAVEGGKEHGRQDT